ncbi:hypothetical protein [Bacillus litorisediminis]|uniref:hypothetical protein n=1 Tax=Bacillus litorisediminis TaxID=2922713 RepID=UPI001FAE48BC|nr:hypothetical protein [Bacillus litorisediminis]
MELPQIALTPCGSIKKAETDRMIAFPLPLGTNWSPVDRSSGEWQISRVYSVLERGEPALYHTKRNLEICQEHGIGNFDLTFAYEAMARENKVLGNTAEV